MRIGKYPVKHSFRLARIISDVLSLGIAFLIVNATLKFFTLYRQTINRIGAENIKIIYEYGYNLAYRQYVAWIFPALVLGIFAAYLILTLKSHRFEKYSVTRKNAQSVYDWYSFAVSLCKIPALMGVFDMMYITHQRLLMNKVSIFSVQLILDAVIIALIIRLSVHRIRRLTETEKPPKKETDGVKARLADDNDNNDNKE